MKTAWLVRLPGFMAFCCASIISHSRLAYAQTADSFDPNPDSSVNTAVPGPDGTVLVGGGFLTIDSQSHRSLDRLFADGSLDQGFASWVTNVNLAGGLNCLALHTNSQILIGGTFKGVINRFYYNAIARLNPDGSLDTNFAGKYVSGGNSSVSCLIIQPDNKILAGGSFTSINFSNITGICRLNWDGTLDTNFNAAANGMVYSINLQPNGKMMVEGSFTSIGGGAYTNLARLNADGSIDPTFQPPVFTSLGQNRISNNGGMVLVQPDGKILVGGLFDKVNGLGHTNIVRLNVNGSIDVNFTAQADLHDSWGLQTLSLQADGKSSSGTTP